MTPCVWGEGFRELGRVLRLRVEWISRGETGTGVLSGMEKFSTKCFRLAPVGGRMPRAVPLSFLMTSGPVGVGGMEVM